MDQHHWAIDGQCNAAEEQSPSLHAINPTVRRTRASAARGEPDLHERIPRSPADKRACPSTKRPRQYALVGHPVSFCIRWFLVAVDLARGPRERNAGRQRSWARCRCRKQPVPEPQRQGRRTETLDLLSQPELTAHRPRAPPRLAPRLQAAFERDAPEGHLRAPLVFCTSLFCGAAWRLMGTRIADSAFFRTNRSSCGAFGRTLRTTALADGHKKDSSGDGPCRAVHDEASVPPTGGPEAPSVQWVEGPCKHVLVDPVQESAQPRHGRGWRIQFREGQRDADGKSGHGEDQMQASYADSGDDRVGSNALPPRWASSCWDHPRTM